MSKITAMVHAQGEWAMGHDTPSAEEMGVWAKPIVLFAACGDEIIPFTPVDWAAPLEDLIENPPEILLRQPDTEELMEELVRWQQHWCTEDCRDHSLVRMTVQESDDSIYVQYKHTETCAAAHAPKGR